MAICKEGFNPIKNWIGHPTKFPLDQKTHIGYCYDKETNIIWYWDRHACHEKIIGGCPYVEFGVAEFSNWQKKADLLANRFLIKPEGECYVSYKDGDKTNCNLSNLEWISKEKKWIGEFTYKVQSGIKGIGKYKKKMRNGSIVDRYRVKTKSGEKTFPSFEESKLYLDMLIDGGDDAMTCVDSDEMSISSESPNMIDAEPDNCISHE